MKPVSKKTILKEFSNIISIVSEGIGAKYGVFIETSTKINIRRKEKK